MESVAFLVATFKKVNYREIENAELKNGLKSIRKYQKPRLV